MKKRGLILTFVILMLTIWPVYSQSTDETVPQGLTIHVVQRGENLFRIALRYGLTTDELAQINGITNVSTIFAGQRLLVPAAATPEPAQTHIVQPGETLNSIAQTYGVQIETILNLNEIANVNQIYTGQVLTLRAAQTPQDISAEDSITPTQPPVEAAIAVTETSPAPSNIIHTVQPGETLFRIAQRYGLTTVDLTTANSISDPTRIFTGQQLLIPLQSNETVITDLPYPIMSLQVRPLIFIEGKTATVQFRTDITSNVRATFMNQALSAFSEQDGTLHNFLFGIPMFVDPGIYPFDITVDSVGGQTTTYTFNARVDAGPYGSQTINISADRMALLSPAVEQEELGLLTRITRQVTPTRYFQGPFSLPAAAAMNSPYGTRRSYNGSAFDRYHNGADFASAPGASIFAAAPGQVVMADTLNIRGNAIAIDHGWGVFSTYSHLSALYVSPGDIVSTGQVIGAAGATGRVTGSHLHWEIWINGVAVDPLEWTRQSFP